MKKKGPGLGGKDAAHQKQARNKKTIGGFKAGDEKHKRQLRIPDLPNHLRTVGGI